MSRFLNRVNRIINDKTLELLNVKPGDRILEVGFGGGDLLNRILPCVHSGFVAGADYSPAMVSFCQQRFAGLVKQGKLNLQCAPAEQLPFADGHFNKLCTVNTLYFWDNPHLVLTEFHRLLGKGGLLVLSFGDKESMEKNPLTQNNFTLYDKEQAEQLLTGAGFTDICIIPHNSGKEIFYCACGYKKD